MNENRERSSRPPRLRYENVYREYVVNGRSDREIASLNGVTRGAVSHFRKRHGIETRVTAASEGHDLVKEQLVANGYSLRDMRDKSKTFRFNFLVERVCRVQVFSASLTDTDSWKFFLSPREESEVSEDNHYFVRMKNGQMKKDLSKSCDVVILCGIYGDAFKMFIIPSKAIPISLQTISIPFHPGKWRKWFNRWDVLDKVIQQKRGSYESDNQVIG